MSRPGRRQRVQPHEADADRLLLGWRPAPERGQLLLDWVRARAWRANPDSHTVPCDLRDWSEVVGDRWPALLDPAGPATISREQVFEVGDRCRATGDFLPLLAATYAWGYASGLGLYRFGVVASGLGVEAVLAEAIEVLDSGGAVSAYGRLRGAVKHFGPAFFTKFLYFSCRSASVGPRPLILDARVAAACRSVTRSSLRQTGLNEDVADEVAWWQWGKGGWTQHRYDVYLQFAENLSGQLGEVGDGSWPRGRADALELALFDRGLLSAGAWT